MSHLPIHNCGLVGSSKATRFVDLAPGAAPTATLGDGTAVKLRCSYDGVVVCEVRGREVARARCKGGQIIASTCDAAFESKGLIELLARSASASGLFGGAPSNHEKRVADAMKYKNRPWRNEWERG